MSIENKEINGFIRDFKYYNQQLRSFDIPNDINSIGNYTDPTLDPTIESLKRLIKEFSAKQEKIL
jgi:hypothetical protein